MNKYRKQLIDRGAAWVIRAGGIGIIFCVVAVVVVVAVEALPLFFGADGAVQAVWPASGGSSSQEGTKDSPLAAGLEQYREVFFVVTPDARVTFHSVADGKPLESVSVKKAGSSRLVAAYLAPEGGHLAVATEDGRIILGRVRFRYVFDDEGKRSPTWSFRERRETFQVPEGGTARLLAYRQSDDGALGLACVTRDDRLYVLYADEEALEEPQDLELTEITIAPKTPLLTLALARSGEKVIVGTAGGEVHWRLLGAAGEGQDGETIDVSDARVTALCYLIGDSSLAVGDSEGTISIWSRVLDPSRPSGRRFERIHQMPRLDSSVVALAPSTRDKGFAAVEPDGTFHLQHATSETEHLRLETTGEEPLSFAFSAKMDGGILLDRDGQVALLNIDNPHPEVSVKTLFGKVWYEGYAEPEYVWQSSAATDDAEPKFSLIPLIFGTFKATFYALLFSVPLSVLAAIYTSQFLGHRGRGTIKPVVEVMAALPTVVVGFLAGLWLAPVVKASLASVLLGFVLVPMIVLLAVLLWWTVPEGARARLWPGTELVVMGGLLVGAVWLSAELGRTVEVEFFGADLKMWMLDTFGWHYDERNSLVVGIAMGFAVIPIIYTISEDALSAVPRHLKAGSLALGASRWQTAIRVVLPTASPGIFSAIMIGFGRAVGETMIVLMATGNTPVMDWTIFNGMRTMSANIAVEIPEAPHGGTLYRILFLTAFLLFVLTFFFNTVAEVTRIRLRRRYQRL